MKNFICIECPRGCQLSIDDDLKVTGNTCIRGEKYAINEIKNPTRILTTTVVINSKLTSRLPVISSTGIPKAKINEVMEILKKVRIQVPINCKDVIISNVCDLGVDILSTRTLKE